MAVRSSTDRLVLCYLYVSTVSKDHYKLYILEIYLSFLYCHVLSYLAGATIIPLIDTSIRRLNYNRKSALSRKLLLMSPL